VNEVGVIESKIRGVEHEYGVNTYPPLADSFSRNLLIDKAVEGLLEAGYISKARWSLDDEVGNLDYERDLLSFWMLPGEPHEAALNGMRVYNDAEHFETSTPAYRTPLDAVIYDKVGDVFTYLGIEKAKKSFATARAYKNNLSTLYTAEKKFESNAYGTHGNIIVDRKVCNYDRWSEIQRALVPYFVVRILLIGSGDFVPCLKEGEKYSFHFHPASIPVLVGDSVKFTISPRVMFLKQITSMNTSTFRGLINERDEPHADPSKYWRLHDINFEAIKSDFQIFIRDCLQTLTICALERGLLEDAPQISDPLNAVKELSVDTEGCNWKIELKDGRKVDAVSEILEGFYLAKIEEMLSREEVSLYDKVALNTLKGTIQKLNERDLECLVDGIDWITKKALVEEYGATEVESLGICNEYSLIDKSVLFYLGEKVNFDECDCRFIPTDSLAFIKDAVPTLNWDGLNEKIRYALLHGPEDTREYFRSSILNKFPGAAYKITWWKVFFDKGIVHLSDPFKLNKQECGEIVEKAESIEDVLKKIEVSPPEKRKTI
jgi:proteasome accessory factor A